ncbi:hypothetical protein [Phenylobacterium sp.]|uniref:hypothetical protein n=1 Tax=Phenylobacterium sp. TaxID=1871053 RepID=UPI002FC8DAA1
MPRDDVAQPSSDGAGSGPPAAAPDSLMGRLLAMLLQGMPLIFGLGFIAPLIAQLLERALPDAAHAQWPLLVGLAIGGSWGAFANLKGRWL